jgi:hypothetical protein
MDLIPTDFLQYPQYFSLIMIWASGYIFAYCVFGKSRAWKEFDSTIKVVAALLVGFAVEFCLILPIFYAWSFANLSTSLFFPAFDATWTYHWILTGFVTVLFLRFRNRETLLKAFNLTFEKVLYYVFFGWLAILFILLIEFFGLGFYSSFVWAASGYLGSYLLVNMIFAALGILFCLFFKWFATSAYEEEKIYGGKVTRLLLEENAFLKKT